MCAGLCVALLGATLSLGRAFENRQRTVGPAQASAQ
jgi:hypothetical protein